MRKLFFGMLAIVAMIATSCQQEADLGVNAGETATVTFNVGAPTRAYSDGRTATVLQYAVYDAAGEELTDLTVTDGEINISTSVKLQLVTGNTYSVIFWAAAEGAPYTVDFANKTMTVDYNGAVSNAENRDAFYKYHTFTVKGAQTETIELRRPFAQLNIGTSDYDAATSAGYTPTKSEVSVSKIYSTLNLWTGAVSNPTDVTFGLANIKKDEIFPVTGYEYLAMNYLLVNERENIEVEFTYDDANAAVQGEVSKTRTVGSVPVQRNHRTNLYGAILTSDVTINVEIKPEYDGAHEADALFLAAAVGGEVTLNDDVTLESTLLVQNNMTIDLNGHTISASIHKNDGPVIKNNAGVTLTIVGGTISSLEENGGSAIANNGTMVVIDATLNGAVNANGSWPSYTVNNTGNLTLNNVVITSHHGAVASYGDDAVVTLNDSEIEMQGIPGFTSHGIYTYNNGKVIVNGGSYTNYATDQAASGASVINGAVTVNDGNFSGRIENYYGTPVLKGGSYTVKPNNNFIAAGYKAIEKNGKYYVVAEEVGAVVANDAELKAAFDAGHTTIYMKAGIYDTKNFQVMYKTLYLKGIEEGVKIYNSQNNDVACTSLDMCTVTFENLTIETLGGNYKGFARMNGTYKNCTIVNNYFTCYGEHLFENCTFNAPTLTGSFNNEHCVWTYGAEKVVFNNCVFNYSDRCVNVYVDNGGNTPGITSDITFSQCKFNTENTASEGAIEVNSSPFTAGVKVVVNGCTAPAYGKLVYVSRWDNKKGKNATILVDGELLVTPVTTAEALKEAITNGEKTIYVSGQIDLTEEILALYNGTIIGADDTACLNTRTFVVKAADEAFHLSDKTINFKNITIKVPAEDGDWLKTGFVAAGTMNFDHCVFEGQVTLNGSATWTFDDCEFGGADSGAYASFVYGAKKVNFNRCSFSGVDRAAKVYGTGGVLDVEYNNCTFTSTTSNKYAVNIDASYATTKIALNGCSQTGMPGLYLVAGTKATVYVDGELK